MRRHWITLSLLTVAGISFAIMQTLVIPALPFFRAEFGTSQEDTTWLVTGFLLSSSVFTPLLGKLGDMYGKKRLMVFCLVVFGTIGAAVGAQVAAAVISAHTPVGALVPDESGFTIAFALAACAATLALIPAFAIGRRRRRLRLRPALSPA